jgi:DNA-directed RNA polymerase I and III subunit RPAC1
MDPKIDNIIESDGILTFRLFDINVSLANALRRVILSEIPTVVFKTDSLESNNCIIHENTSRQHNEILKQRLGCIPIHFKENIFGKESDYKLVGNYTMELDVTNDTDNIMFVTTEHFKIKNKNNGKYMSDNEVKKIFPKNEITQYYIDFARLRPKISDTIPGERIKLECVFSFGEAINNSMYNVVSKCSYGNTMDAVKKEAAWDKYRNNISSDYTEEEIQFQKKNFDILDAQKYFIENSFDFVIQSIGVYDNIEIVKYGCMILQHKFIDMINALDSDNIPIIVSETTMENSYDVILEDEDYTIGYPLQYILYNTFFEKEKKITFCGFKKYHPHDSESILRIALVDNFDRTVVRQLLRSACVDAQEVFTKIYKLL